MSAAVDLGPPDPLDENKVDPRSQLILHSGPFSGDFNGVAWNAQGYFMSTVIGQTRKRHQLSQYLKARDFALLSEAHCATGGIQGHRDIPGTKSWWSCGGAARAGVGIVVKDSFLKQFGQSEPVWLEAEPGRLARLRLQGGSGTLDLVAAYFPTGTRKRLHDDTVHDDLHAADPALRQQRQQLVVGIRRLLDPEVALTVLAGDFNFVTCLRDRLNLQNGQYTGDRDAAEQNHWNRLLPQPLLHEWFQDEHTYKSSLASSRIDRVFANSSVADQLDKRLFVVVLPSSALSLHRPLAFGRVTKPKTDNCRRTVEPHHSRGRTLALVDGRRIP